MATGATEGLWVRNLLRDMGLDTGGLVVWTDSSAAKALCAKNLTRVKHMEMKYFFLKDFVKKGEIEVRKIRGDSNPADLLTKPVSKETLFRLRCVLLG